MLRLTMLTLFFLVLFGPHDGMAVTHSLKYFYTGSSQIPNFPEFVTVGMVDDIQIDYYDSTTGRARIKQDWMKNVIADDPQYLERNSQIYKGNEPGFKGNIEIARQRFNQTKGVHIFQNMYGCEWDDESEEKKGYDQYGYDGEDLIALDLKTELWIAPAAEAVITKNKWDQNKARLGYLKTYYTEDCPIWLKKYLQYGKSSLMRKDLPSVSFLQKTPSSPVTCHATGFYPNKAEIFWRKNGNEIHEGVDKGEILPNSDGSFQMSVDMDLSSAEDWTKYECVFQLSGADDFAHPLEKSKIKTNYSNSNVMIIPIIVAVVVLACVAVIGFILYKKKNGKRPPSPVDGAEVQEQMIPQA